MIFRKTGETVVHNHLKRYSRTTCQSGYMSYSFCFFGTQIGISRRELKKTLNRNIRKKYILSFMEE